jgi:hypothetical protein
MAAIFGKTKSNITESNDGDLIVDFSHKKNKHKCSQSHDEVFETMGGQKEQNTQKQKKTLPMTSLPGRRKRTIK